MRVFVQLSLCVCLFSHFPFLISHVCGFADSRAYLTRAEAWLRPTQTCGWRLWLRKEGRGREKEKEEKGRETGVGESRKKRDGQGVRDGMSSPSSPWAGERSSCPWIQVWKNNSTHTVLTNANTDTNTHTDATGQLKIAKQRPSTTSANYLAESRPGSRIRAVPAVGLGWRKALIEIKSERKER